MASARVRHDRASRSIAERPRGASPAAAAAPTAPPPVKILTDQPGFGRGEDLFVTPTGDTETYAQGPEILSPSGQELWFQPVPAGLAATDFRTQTYLGQRC